MSGGPSPTSSSSRTGRYLSTKVLTTHSGPEVGILDGLVALADEHDVDLSTVEQVIHGTTLATNALIERSGARTAFVTTDGFRDVIETRTEGRFEQYDLNIVLPTPLIQRKDRFVVPERLDARGEVLRPFDDEAAAEVIGSLIDGGYEAVAVGFLHSYRNGVNERRFRDLLLTEAPDLAVSISSEVSPQIREFERFNTVCANAYLQPLMASYLRRLQDGLSALGATCEVYLIHSGGGLVSVEHRRGVPGATRGVGTGRRCDLRRPPGGPLRPRSHHVVRHGWNHGQDRPHRGRRAADGQDVRGRPQHPIQEGQRHAHLDPGDRDDRDRRRWRFDRQRRHPRPDPHRSPVGRLRARSRRLRPGRHRCNGHRCQPLPRSAPPRHLRRLLDQPLSPQAEAALQRSIGDPLGLDVETAAVGIAEMVDENMTNAARVHAVENGKDLAEFSMIAFGGGAPLHATRLMDKLGLTELFVPEGAGVGSAIGFLLAPFSYEAVRSFYTTSDDFDADGARTVLEQLEAEAEAFVRRGTDADTATERQVSMRYRGQGWEIPVSVPSGNFGATTAEALLDRVHLELPAVLRTGHRRAHRRGGELVGAGGLDRRRLPRRSTP